MIDHIGIAVTDLEKSIAFYEKALAPLGYAHVMTHGKAAGFGPGGKPIFWIEGESQSGGRNHVAIRTSSRKLVREFHAAAIAAGGKDNGAPGPRPHYHPDYYGAFVLDPDGHNIEAVCHSG